MTTPPAPSYSEETLTFAKRLHNVIDQQAIPVDEDTDDDVQVMMAEEKKSMLNNYQEGSFQRLFWEEQKQQPRKISKAFISIR